MIATEPDRQMVGKHGDVVRLMESECAYCHLKCIMHETGLVLQLPLLVALLGQNIAIRWNLETCEIQVFKKVSRGQDIVPFSLLCGSIFCFLSC